MNRVAVVGAGIIGASIAWRLADAGLDVRLYDAGTFSGEASTAAAGMLAPGGEVTHLGGLAQDTVEARMLYRSWAQQLETASGHSVDYLECGAIDLAFDDAEWTSILERRQMLAQLGIHAEVLSENDLRDEIPGLTPESCRALHFPGDALVSPLDIAKALRLVLDSRKNVTLLENTPVASCQWKQHHFVLVARGGILLPEADAVVLAAGAWAGEIHLDLPHQDAIEPPREAIPVRGHMIYCHRDPGTLGPIVRHDHLYVLQRTNGSVLAGSSEERIGFHRNPNPATVAHLLQRTRRILPNLFPTQPEASWIGFRPGIAGSGPEVRQMGELPLWLAYGHYRNGILLAPHTARQVAAGIETVAGKLA